MSIMDNIKNHIQNNKVKYGVTGAGVAGIGAGTLLANNHNTVSNNVEQALYNAGAYGARGIDKFGNAIGIPTLSNGLPNVSPEEQEAANRLYNMNLPDAIRPEVGQLLNSSKDFIHESTQSGLMDKTKLEGDFELPVLSFESGGDVVEFDAVFSDKLQKSLASQSREEARYCLIGSYVDFTNNCIVSTNGHRLFKGALNLNCKAKGVIIPTKACKILLTCCKLFGDFSLDVTESKVKAWNNEFELVFKTIDGTFPDYSRVIPEGVDYKPLNLEPLKKLIKGWAFNDRAKAVKLTGGKVFAGTVELGSFNYPFNFEVGYNGNYVLQIPQSKNDNVLAYQEAENTPLKMVQGSDLYILMGMRV